MTRSDRKSQFRKTGSASSLLVIWATRISSNISGAGNFSRDAVVREFCIELLAPPD
jgi:hypothetical protein